jgi:hypothetical protein
MTKKEQQPQRQSLTMEHLTRIAGEHLLTTGQHLPMVIIEGHLRTQMVVIEDMPSTHGDRAQQMAEIGFALAKQMDVGKLRQMVLITEGWLSVGTEDRPPQIPPSKDPERVEVLLINQLDIRARKYHLMVLEVVRDGAGVIREVRPHASMKETEGMTAESPLVDALLLGYLAAKRPPKD